MTDVASAMATLEDLAHRLDLASRELYKVTEELEPIERKYREWIDDYEVGMYREAVESESRLPSEKLRERLALSAMDHELREMFLTFTARRERMLRRIKDLGILIDAQRSLLSAYKVEVEATT